MTLNVRRHFPGLRDEHARFDGPAGTLVVDAAIDAMRDYLASDAVANVGGCFDPSVRTGELLEGARTTVAGFLGAGADNVVFGANMTTLTFAFTRTVGRTLEPGDEIVCTELDHDANLTPWRMVAEERGATVRLAQLDPTTGRLPVENVTACITDRTKWVAVTGASNLIGTMPDVAAITAAAHDAGAKVFVDAVHLAPHRRIDFEAIGCDALVTSPYKWYGPHAGVLVLRDVETWEPYKVRPAPDRGPRRFETGTPSFEAIAGVAAAARWLTDIGMDAIAEHEQSVFRRLLDGLLAVDGVTVHGPHDHTDRAPTVLFDLAGTSPDELAAGLAQDGVTTWAGHSYALEAARALGCQPGVGVRAGVACYTNDADVDRLLDAVRRRARPPR